MIERKDFKELVLVSSMKAVDACDAEEDGDWLTIDKTITKIEVLRKPNLPYSRMRLRKYVWYSRLWKKKES